MALDFPASSASPFTAPNGVIYTWNTDGYWEATNTNEGNYLKLDATNGPVTGPLTFEDTTTHEEGVYSGGQLISIKEEGFPQTQGTYNKFATLAGNVRTVESGSLSGQGLNFYNYRNLEGETNQQTETVIIDGPSTWDTPFPNARCYIKFNSTSPDNNGGFVSFGGLGDLATTARPSFKVFNSSNGLAEASGSTVDIATFFFPANPGGGTRTALKYVSRRVSDGASNNQQAMCIEGTRGAIRFDSGGGTALSFYSNNGSQWAEAGRLSNGSWSGLSFRSVDIELDGDQETAFTTSYSTDENGEQVETQTYNGETQSLQSIIRELKDRIAVLEANTLQPLYSTLADLPSAADHHGKVAHVHDEGALYFAHSGNWVKLQNA